MPVSYMPNIVQKKYHVLVEKRSRLTVISCTLCEKERQRDPNVQTFNFEIVKAAVGWAKSNFARKSLLPNSPYSMCTHVLLDYAREIDYPIVLGEVIEDDISAVLAGSTTMIPNQHEGTTQHTIARIKLTKLDPWERATDVSHLLRKDGEGS